VSKTVQLTPRLEAKVEELLATGRYADAGEVVDRAVSLLAARERGLEELRALLAVGEEQEERGDVVEFTPELFEEIKRNAHERAKAGDTPSPDVCP
jgi:putative addiction module CopG family antidote